MKPQVSLMRITCPYCNSPSEIVFHTEPLPPKEIYEGGRPPFVPSYISEAEGDILKGRDGELIDPSTGRLMHCGQSLPPAVPPIRFPQQMQTQPHVAHPAPPPFAVMTPTYKKRRGRLPKNKAGEQTTSGWWPPKSNI